MTTTYPTDASIGVISMTNRKPDRGFSSEFRFDSIMLESQSGYEVRRQRSRRPKRRYNLTYTNINGNYRTAIQNFYNARGGDYEFFSSICHT